MPFVKRVVTPKYVCRKQRQQGSAGAAAAAGPNETPSTSKALVALPLQDHELESITNVTLSNALRQLASLLLISNEIFAELNHELESITERSMSVKKRIEALAQKVDAADPKLVPVRKYTFFFLRFIFYGLKVNQLKSFCVRISLEITMKDNFWVMVLVWVGR